MWFWLSFKLLHVFSYDLGDCKVHTWFKLFSSVLFLAYLGLYVVCSFVVFYTISDIFDEKRLLLSFVSISCLFSSTGFLSLWITFRIISTQQTHYICWHKTLILYTNIDKTLMNSLHILLNCEIGGLDCRVITTEYRTRVHFIHM